MRIVSGIGRSLASAADEDAVVCGPRRRPPGTSQETPARSEGRMGQRHTVDYRHVTPTSVTEAVYTALAEVDALVEAVIEDRDRTYHATLGRLEAAGILLGDVTGRAAFLGHVHPDADVRDAGHTAEERGEEPREHPRLGRRGGCHPASCRDARRGGAHRG